MIKPTHTPKLVPNLNCRKTVLQYNMNTVSTIYLFLALNIKWDPRKVSVGRQRE